MEANTIVYKHFKYDLQLSFKLVPLHMFFPCSKLMTKSDQFKDMNGREAMMGFTRTTQTTKSTISACTGGSGIRLLQATLSDVNNMLQMSLKSDRFWLMLPAVLTLRMHILNYMQIYLKIFSESLDTSNTSHRKCPTGGFTFH